MRNNNITSHISDYATSVLLDVTDTPFDSSVVNLQQAMEALGEHSLEGGLPLASETVDGVLRIATETDIDEGTNNDKAVSPAGLAYALDQPNATETDIGWTRYSTDAESLNTTFNDAAATPKSIHHVFDNRNADETTFGTMRISSQNQAINGTENTTSMTPLRVKQAIDAFTDPVATATESNEGIVELATVTEANTGTIRDGFAISPYTFVRANSTESNFGTARLATQSETNALSSDTRVITPAKLGGLGATTSQKGIARVATTSEAQGLSNDTVIITPSKLNDVTATTSQKGIVELATASEANAQSSSSLALTPNSLTGLRASSNSPNEYGLARLSDSLTSTSRTHGASTYAAKLLNDKIDNISNDVNDWEELVNYGTSRSTSSVIYIQGEDLDGYEYRVVYINDNNSVYSIAGVYSSYFNNGNISNLVSQNSIYNPSTGRFALPRGEDKFILVMRRRVSWLPRGNSNTSGSGSGGTSGGGGGGGCLSLTTQIELYDGTIKDAKDIVVGDELKSVYISDVPDASEDSNWKSWTNDNIDDREETKVKVVDIQTHDYDGIYTVNNTLDITEGHEILSLVNGQWAFRDVKHLVVGNYILDIDNEVKAIKSIKYNNDTVKVVNFDVEPNDTYFAGGILVHNKEMIDQL